MTTTRSLPHLHPSPMPTHLCARGPRAVFSGAVGAQQCILRTRRPSLSLAWPSSFAARCALPLRAVGAVHSDGRVMESSDGITVRTTTDRGRGVFATRALEHGATLVRAIPAACVPGDAYLRTCCCVCLQRTVSLPCAKCGAAVLCARCASSRGARLIHEDECASLRMLFAHEDRPADTRSLRLLMRLILWKWRCSQPDAPQYIGESDDDEGAAGDGDGGDGGGDWWGDGDACADTPEDLMDLCEPPEEEEWEGSAALERKLLEMASQARYYLPAHTRLSRHLAAEIMGRVDCRAAKVVTSLRPWVVAGMSCMGPLRARRACADGCLQPSRVAATWGTWTWDMGWCVACGGRHVSVAATPPTILPPRSIEPFHPGLLQRPRSVRGGDGQGPRRRGHSQGPRAGARCAGAVDSRGRGGGHGSERLRGDAQPSLRSQRRLEPRRKRRPSGAKCLP